jgi:ferrous iron transport protein A
MLQLSFNKRGNQHSRRTTLNELKRGQQAVLDRIQLPEGDTKRLMELGFVPGHVVEPARSAPGGEPRVYRVDGSEIALRKETAKQIVVIPKSGSKPPSTRSAGVS